MVSERAFARLRWDLLSGLLASGSRLKIEDLQRRYGYSSSPLREALNRLTQEGLVRTDDRRGFRVAPVSVSDLNDITRMRNLIEVDALAQSIRSGDDAWEAEVVAAFHLLDRVESRLSDGPVALDTDWSRLHRSFHMAMLSACPSQRQRSWSASLFDQAERYRHISARHRPRSQQSVQAALTHLTTEA